MSIAFLSLVQAQLANCLERRLANVVLTLLDRLSCGLRGIWWFQLANNVDCGRYRMTVASLPPSPSINGALFASLRPGCRRDRCRIVRHRMPVRFFSIRNSGRRRPSGTRRRVCCWRTKKPVMTSWCAAACRGCSMIFRLCAVRRPARMP
jgi:hypothetical protein